MGRTGRKTIADKETRARVVAVAKSNPSMSAAAIAERFSGVTPRQVQYWLTSAKKKESKGK